MSNVQSASAELESLIDRYGLQNALAVVETELLLRRVSVLLAELADTKDAPKIAS